MIQLSVIIVNYNGLKYLRGCFDSLYQKLSGIQFEIIVVDNDSTDDSCPFIRQHYPEVVLIESKENLGFGRGNNEGVKHAKGDYLLLLNNDTILLDHLLPLLNILKQDAQIGAAGINMLNKSKEYLISVGKFPGLFTLARLKNIAAISHEFTTGIFKKERYEVDWISGSFMMMPKQVYNDIKGFDADYFMYVEDVDLCKKISDLGLKRVFFPQFSYIHFVGYNSSKDPLIIKGWEMFINKHYTGYKKAFALIALNLNKAVKKGKMIYAGKLTHKS